MAKQFCPSCGMSKYIDGDILIPCPLFLIFSEKHEVPDWNFSFKVNKKKQVPSKATLSERKKG